MLEILLICSIYWGITTLILVGLTYDTVDTLGQLFISLILSMLLGWIVVPFILGRALAMIQDNDEINKQKSI